MKIIWQNQAIAQRFSISEYIKNEFGMPTARKFNSELIRCKTLIQQNPYIAPIEPLLSGMEKEYRSILINRLSKMIYFAEADKIYIVALWDTRRCPDAMKDDVK